MRYLYVAAILLLAAAASALPFATKTECEANNYFWCYRCSGVEGNPYATDTCVASNSECTYSCSGACGAQCVTNSDCGTWLNESSDTCYYSGMCSACKCIYLEQDCPRNGTVKDGVCYYGKRECSSSGCATGRCTLAEGQVCNPETGCVFSESEYYEDYRCEGSRVFAKKVYYSCNGTECAYSRYDAFMEECRNGCTDGKCNEVLCNMNGIIIDCNIYDGFYDSPYCSGNDVVRSKRDYTCADNECVYTMQEVKQQSCSSCENGRCISEASENVTPAQNYTTPQNQTPAKIITIPDRVFDPGIRIFNGWLFGQRDLAIDTHGKSTVNFTITDTNRFGDLTVTADGNTIYTGRPAKGVMSLRFAGNRLVFTTSTSGWLFFAPAIYDIKYVLVY